MHCTWAAYTTDAACLCAYRAESPAHIAKAARAGPLEPVSQIALLLALFFRSVFGLQAIRRCCGVLVLLLHLHQGLRQASLLVLDDLRRARWVAGC